MLLQDRLRSRIKKGYPTYFCPTFFILVLKLQLLIDRFPLWERLLKLLKGGLGRTGLYLKVGEFRKAREVRVFFIACHTLLIFLAEGNRFMGHPHPAL